MAAPRPTVRSRVRRRNQETVSGRGVGVCLQAAGVSEAVAIVSNLSQGPGAELDA